jgi:hypothetical protein
VQHRQSSLKGRVRAWSALGAALIAIAAFAQPASAEPAKFWGINPQAQPSLEQFQRLKQGGVDTMRVPLEWGSIEKTKGVFDWTYSDGFVTSATLAGIEVLPFLTGAPGWAVRTATVPGSSAHAPLSLPVRNGKQRSAWQQFLRAAVGRYGPKGSFWAANPSVPKRPIRIWQIWNEANFKYFVARPNPAEFGKLVKISHAALKGADRGAQVILGGLFVHPKEGDDKHKRQKPRQAYFATEFLEKMYRSTPGVKRQFNGIALHPYSPTYKRLKPDIEEVRRVMKKAKDPSKLIWITELTWSSNVPSASNCFNQFEKGPQGQVTQLKGAFRVLKKNYRKWKIKRVFWFSVDDQPTACNFCDGSGLFSEGFVPKPSWPAYVQFAGGTP